MIKAILTTIACFVLATLAQGQQAEVRTGYFDNDRLVDTLQFRFVQDTGDGPVYRCHLVRGNGRQADFSIGVGFKSMRISDCSKPGCIETYQWKGGSNGIEETTIYRYAPKYDTWLLEKRVTIEADGPRKTYRPKSATGIDGTAYSGKTSK